MNSPKISIITIAFNEEKTLLKTIQSITNQTYKNIEYIVVDGASTDGTMKIIDENRHRINIVVSESDKGLYDAMNKGLHLATGRYVWFINSGDEIADREVLSNIFNQLPPADIYYGDTMIIDNKGKEIGKRRLSPPERLTWKDFKRGMVVSHQSIIVKKSICQPYNLKYRFSADFEWVLFALKNSKTIINTHQTLSKYLDGGLTKKNIRAGLKERFKIMVDYYGLLPTILSHIPIAFKFVFFIARNKRF